MDWGQGRCRPHDGIYHPGSITYSDTGAFYRGRDCNGGAPPNDRLQLRSQFRGEDLADYAVVPALGLSTLAASVVDPNEALAVINSERGTGIR